MQKESFTVTSGLISLWLGMIVVTRGLGGVVLLLHSLVVKQSILYNPVLLDMGLEV